MFNPNSKFTNIQVLATNSKFNQIQILASNSKFTKIQLSTYFTSKIYLDTSTHMIHIQF